MTTYRLALARRLQETPVWQRGRLLHAGHGASRPGQCPSGVWFDCIDVTLTLAVSTDGGATFSHAAPPPNHLVAAYLINQLTSRFEVSLLSPDLNFRFDAS